MLITLALAASIQTSAQILVFTRTTGFRHDSIPDGVRAFKELGQQHNFQVTHTEDPTQFNSENLKRFRAVVFLNTTGDVLEGPQEVAFEAFVRSGGGFVGVHSAADTEYGWPFYGDLVGAYFKSHPHIQQATIRVLDRTHPSTKHLGETWVRTDEWYCFQAQPKAHCSILCELDESTYQGGTMGERHPIAWYHSHFGGRAFYTGGGHTKESYQEPDFRLHLLGGLRWAARL